MDIKVTGPEDYEEQGIKPPRSRNLLPSKKYRESVKRWGEPTELKRRRVIIVPSIKCAARDVTATTTDKGKKITNAIYFGSSVTVSVTLENTTQLDQTKCSLTVAGNRRDFSTVLFLL